MRKILMLGASEILKELGQFMAKDGFDITFASRDISHLQSLKSDLQLRFNVEVKLINFDILDSKSFESFVEDNKDIDGIVCAIGTMEGDLEHLVRVNFLNIAILLDKFKEIFKLTPQGKFIAVISSVAGDRGRKSNYFYGSAKAGLNAYLSGLRNELDFYKIQVLTIKPGFINTKMTRNIKLPKILTAQPKIVANDIYKAIKNKKDVIYSLKRWRFIMLIIRLLPECIFKKLNL